MGRARYGYLRGNWPLSPVANVPWVMVVSLFLWLLVGFAWPPGPQAHQMPFQIFATFIALLSFGFYAYKATENGFLLFAPDRWWTTRYTGDIPRRKGLAILDMLDLYIPYFLVTGVVGATLIAYIPTAFSNIDIKESPFEQLLRLSITTGLSSYGVGFTSIVPVGTVPEIVIFVLAVFKSLVILLIIGSISSVLLNQSRSDRGSRRDRRQHRSGLAAIATSNRHEKRPSNLV